MKKYIIGIVLGVIVAFPLSAFAGMLVRGVTEDGWIELETSYSRPTRFIDEDYGLVCWVVTGNGTGISCVKK